MCGCVNVYVEDIQFPWLCDRGVYGFGDALECMLRLQSLWSWTFPCLHLQILVHFLFEFYVDLAVACQRSRHLGGCEYQKHVGCPSPNRAQLDERPV